MCYIPTVRLRKCDTWETQLYGMNGMKRYDSSDMYISMYGFWGSSGGSGRLGYVDTRWFHDWLHRSESNLGGVR